MIRQFIEISELTDCWAIAEYQCITIIEFMLQWLWSLSLCCNEFVQEHMSNFSWGIPSCALNSTFNRIIPGLAERIPTMICGGPSRLDGFGEMKGDPIVRRSRVHHNERRMFTCTLRKYNNKLHAATILRLIFCYVEGGGEGSLFLTLTGCVFSCR